MRIVAVGDQLTVDALRLMGIPGTVVTDAESGARALREALEPETVVLVAEEVADTVRETVDELTAARGEWLVLEIPSAQGEPRQAEKTAALLSQAIGMKI